MRIPNIKLLVSVFGSLLMGFTSLSAQVVTYTPEYPTKNDTVTITFDASQGNMGLNGSGQVYMHTGIITDLAVSQADWQYQKALWDSGDDSTIAMTNIGGNKHQITFQIKDFYRLGSNSDERLMAMVFRNEDGSQVGKNADGTDIYIPIFDDTELSATWTKPATIPVITDPGQLFTFEVSTNKDAMINLFREGTLVAQKFGKTLSYSSSLSAYGKTNFHYEVQSGGTTLKDTSFVLIKQATNFANIPAGYREGINYIDDNTALLVLQAPFKDFIYVLGDFNDWKIDPAYRMNKTPDNERYWLQIDNLQPGVEYAFQYLIDQDVKVTDPYAEMVLDPFNDPSISAVVYPDLKEYPYGKTTEIVGVLETGQEAYQWEVPDFERPDNRDLVIYELLIRDFTQKHNFQSVIDTLDYLQKMGITAIELMPINEYDGNDSWGYGPSFFCAVDKYYGPRNDLKKLIDECHKRGMAVLLDVVFNHAFGPNPNVRMYWDRAIGKVTPQNPWFNIDIPHPFGVGIDFDHASWRTRDMVDSIMGFWIKEYNFDGYRMDLTKGFTNKWTVGDIGAWTQYDADRVWFLKRFADVFWNKYPGRYLILEHLGEPGEEKELADYGFMLWSKATDQYRQSGMGWETGWDFEGQVSHLSKGWNFHNVVSYMHSHDEERIMYEILEHGNEFGEYSTKDFETAMERGGLIAAFFFTVPGPKMMWQMEELGYDISIFWPSGMDQSRTAKKPVRWKYWEDPDRHRLYKTYGALIKLKTENEAFRTANYGIEAWGKSKQVYITDPSMNVVVCGNFDVAQQWVYTGFQHDGTWYDYMTGESIDVTDVGMSIEMAPGEWHIYTDQQLEVPDLTVPEIEPEDTGGISVIDRNASTVYPNPFKYNTMISTHLDKAQNIDVSIYNNVGAKIKTLSQGFRPSGPLNITWDGSATAGEEVSEGVYFYKITGKDFNATGRIIKIE